MCFINLDGSQKDGGNFFNLLQKEWGTQKGGRGSNPGGNYEGFLRYGVQQTKLFDILGHFLHIYPPNNPEN